jgi:hypothetical protein
MKNKWIILFLCSLSVSTFAQKIEYDVFVELTEAVFEFEMVREAICTPKIEQDGELHIDASTDLSRIYIILNKPSVCKDCGSTRIISKEYGDLIFASSEALFFYDVECFFDPVSLALDEEKAKYSFIVIVHTDGRDKKARLFEVKLKRGKQKWKIAKTRTEQLEDYHLSF